MIIQTKNTTKIGIFFVEKIFTHTGTDIYVSPPGTDDVITAGIGAPRHPQPLFVR